MRPSQLEMQLSSTSRDLRHWSTSQPRSEGIWLWLRSSVVTNAMWSRWYRAVSCLSLKLISLTLPLVDSMVFSITYVLPGEGTVEPSEKIITQYHQNLFLLLIIPYTNPFHGRASLQHPIKMTCLNPTPTHRLPSRQWYQPVTGNNSG